MFIDIIFIKYEKSKIVEIFFVSIQGVPLALRAAGRDTTSLPSRKTTSQAPSSQFFFTNHLNNNYFFLYLPKSKLIYARSRRPVELSIF